MNTAEITNIIPETDFDAMTVTGLSARQQTATRATWEPRVRRVLFALMLVLLVGTALLMHNWIADLEKQIEIISAQIGPSYF